MNPLHGSEAGNSAIDGATEVSSLPTTAPPGVVPHPAATVDRYAATGAWGTRSLPTAFRQVAAVYAERFSSRREPGLAALLKMAGVV